MLDFVSGNRAGMQRQIDATKGTLGEPYVRAWQAHAAASGGHFREAREQFRLTMESALRFGLREVGALIVSGRSLPRLMAGSRRGRDLTAHRYSTGRTQRNVA